MSLDSVRGDYSQPLPPMTVPRKTRMAPMSCIALNRDHAPAHRENSVAATKTMTKTVPVAGKQRLRRWPARLDLLQSGSGLLLGLFMWVHMFFVASILLGKDAMWRVARMFEGYYHLRSATVLAGLGAGGDDRHAVRRACSARVAQVPGELPSVPHCIATT